MPDLFKSKKWLGIKEAAEYLSIMFGGAVTEVDVLREALDKQLKLSLRLVNYAFTLQLEPFAPDTRVWRIRSLDGNSFVEIPPADLSWYLECGEIKFDYTFGVIGRYGVYDFYLGRQW